MKRLILLFIITLFFIACGNSNLPKNGEECKITKESLGAVDEASFSEMNKVCNRKDEPELKRMIALGLVYVVKPYDECKMINAGSIKSKIRVKPNSVTEYEVWISSEFITKKQ